MLLGDGKTKLFESNAIVRYAGKMYPGLKNECLYPSCHQPEAMQAVDDILELSNDFLNSYGPFMLPFAPGYKTRKEEGQPKWLEEKLPKFCEMLCAKHKVRNYQCGYLVTEAMSVADLVLFSHFWKLMFNPACQDSDF